MLLTSCVHCRWGMSCWRRLNCTQSSECFRCGGSERLSGDRVCVRPSVRRAASDCLSSCWSAWGLLLYRICSWFYFADFKAHYYQNKIRHPESIRENKSDILLDKCRNENWNYFLLLLSPYLHCSSILNHITLCWLLPFCILFHVLFQIYFAA